MKTKSFSLLFWACLLWGGHGLAQSVDPASPDLDKAMVTVPYAELKRLLQMGAARGALSGTDQGKPPPVPGGLMASWFRVDCAGGKAALEAEFRVENFSGEWESIPLMGAGPAVAGIDPADARVLAKDGQLCLVTKTLGAATVKLRFVERDLAPHAEGAMVEIDTLPSAVSTLEITGLPDGHAASARSSRDVLPGSTKGLFALPAKGGSIAVWLEEAVKLAAELAPPKPSEWSLQNEIAVRRDDGTLRYSAHCHLSALNGSGLTAEITLPAAARHAKVEGEDLASWRVERMEGRGQRLVLEWKARGVLEREIILSYVMPQPPFDEMWNLAAPSAGIPDQVRSLFVVAVPPLWAVSGQDLRPISDGAGLSRWVTETLAGSRLAVIEGAPKATVMVTPLPQAPTADGTIKLAHYDTRIVADGSSITEAKFEIDHEGAPLFGIDLPADSALLICSLNGQSTRPIAGKGQRLEFQLPPGDGTAAKAEIALSYTTAKEKLDDVAGQLSAELPLTPWFIHSVEWTLTLPESYRISAVDGNVEYGNATQGEHAVALRKRLCRGEAPKANLFYEKRGL